MSQSSFEDKIISACRSCIPVDTSIVVAVSGGCDSIALLFLLHHLRDRLSIRKLVVAHVNYGLRGRESDGDEALVHRYGNALDLPVFVRKMKGHSLSEPGMEEWAREERYSFFRRVCAENACTLIATGHTLEDQAETILMRLLRGSGVNGLQGIAARREDGVVRPLLTLHKPELAQWLDVQGVTYRYDASNSNMKFMRNRVRHELLPLLETYYSGATAHIAAVAAEVQGMQLQRQNQVSSWISENCVMTGNCSLRLNRDLLMNSGIASEGVRQILVSHGISPDRYHIERICNAAADHDRNVLLPGGWYATAGKEYVYIERTCEPVYHHVVMNRTQKLLNGFYHLTVSDVADVPADLDAGTFTVYIDADCAGKQLFIRTVQSDDHIVPFGRSRPVAVHRFLSRLGIPEADRKRTLVLVTDDNKPIWLFAIRLDDRFRVTSSTKRVIKVQSSSIF